VADETKRRRGGGLGGFLSGVLILALAGVVVWLLTERNTRTWYLVPDEGRLVVMHGTSLPFGRETYTPEEAELAEAYAPVVPPEGTTLPPERSFAERALLDQALFELVGAWAKADVASGTKDRLARGLEYLKRAERLPGLSAAQREELAALRAESGFFEAQGLLERAATDLRDAADRLRASAGSRSRHATDARLLLRDVEPAVDAVLSALRAGGPGRAAPPGDAGQPVEAPRPAPVQDGSPPAAPRPPADRPSR
jgi:hypothetical protein